mmetsp:Transcript_54913/g.91477  ORF Transcript_54913/g.91477 Transcript_54913/m.91477 type:complete len:86 (+) Transcript_54913:1205-1462(+)
MSRKGLLACSLMVESFNDSSHEPPTKHCDDLAQLISVNSDPSHAAPKLRTDVQNENTHIPRMTHTAAIVSLCAPVCRQQTYSQCN